MWSGNRYVELKSSRNVVGLVVGYFWMRSQNETHFFFFPKIAILVYIYLKQLSTPSRQTTVLFCLLSIFLGFKYGPILANTNIYHWYHNRYLIRYGPYGIGIDFAIVADILLRHANSANIGYSMALAATDTNSKLLNLVCFFHRREFHISSLCLFLQLLLNVKEPHPRKLTLKSRWKSSMLMLFQIANIPQFGRYVPDYGLPGILSGTWTGRDVFSSSGAIWFTTNPLLKREFTNSGKKFWVSEHNYWISTSCRVN